jgi:type I restriction enzyme S subunit
VQYGDVLVSIVGTIGRVFFVPDGCEGFNIARAIARISPARGVDGRYIAYVLRTTAYQRGLSGASFETARKTLNLEELGKLAIPLPPIGKQIEVVEDLARLSATANQVRSRTLLTAGLKSRILAAMERASV